MKKALNFKFLLFVYFLGYLLHFKISLIQGSDDTWFADASDNAAYLDWISARYMTWSGRLFPDTMLFTLLDEYFWLWRLLNPLFIVLLAYSLVRIIKKEVSRTELILGIVLLGFINNGILNSGFFWVTGSMNYLWPIALGLFAMIPFSDAVFQRKAEGANKLNYLYLICGLIATVSNEQAALCISAFSVISLVVLYIKNKQINKQLLLFTVLFIIGTCILIFAPGNKVRWAGEVSTWYPNFEELSLKDKIYLGFIWLFKQVFIELKYFILLLSITVLALQYKRKETFKWGSYLFFIFLSLALSTEFIGGSLKVVVYNFDLIKEYSISSTLFHFWEINLGFLYAIIPYLFWAGYGILLTYNILLESEHKFFTFLCLAAALCTFCVMFFSPTIYASGSRTLAVGCTLIIIVVMNLLQQFDIVNSRKKIFLLGCFSFLNVLQLFMSY